VKRTDGIVVFVDLSTMAPIFSMELREFDVMLIVEAHPQHQQLINS
jgi:hypothetical protein